MTAPWPAQDADAAHVPDARRIGVLRPRGIGDLVVSLPALEALRAAYPGAEIVLLGTLAHQTLLRDRPGPVDRIVTVPRSRGVNGDDETDDDAPRLRRFLAAMQAERFDLALQLHDGGAFSNPLVQRLGARVTAGAQGPGAVPLDRVVPFEHWQHETLRCLEIASLVGAAPVTLEPRLTVTAADLAEAEAAMPSDGRPLAVLHPGAGSPRRHWPSGKFAALGDELAGAGAAVAVVGAGEERLLARHLTRRMRRPATDLAGRLSLNGLTGLLARAAVYVTNASGSLQLAAAVGAATVGIYWCGDLVTTAPLTRLRHRAEASWRLACPVCGADCLTEGCGHQASFVADVALEDVVDDALDLLTAEGARRAPAEPSARPGVVAGGAG